MTRQPHIKQSRDIVVYDGECGFCHSQVERLKQRDTVGLFEYVPRHEPWLEVKYPELATHNFDTGMRLIKPDGTIHAAADAVYEIARQLPGWRMIAWLYRVPGIKQMCRMIYAWIAARRHRFSGACSINPAQQRDSHSGRDACESRDDATDAARGSASRPHDEYPSPTQHRSGES